MHSHNPRPSHARARELLGLGERSDSLGVEDLGFGFLKAEQSSVLRHWRENLSKLNWQLIHIPRALPAAACEASWSL